MNIFKNKKILTISLILIACFTITLINLIPNDYWWHVKAGEYMVTNGEIPFTDVFSWYGIENNLYWHSHEWLTEVLLFLITDSFGQSGVLVFTALCLGSLFTYIYIANKKLYDTHNLFSLVWIIIGLSTFFFFISPRPHMISFVLFALVLSLLFKFREDENFKYIWLVPLISIFWVNFHGGSSNLPYILCLMFILTGLFNLKIGKIKFDKLSKKQLKSYFLIGCLSFFALLLNPHGIDMISYPYLNMNDTVMLNFIAEWQSPNIKNFHELAFVIPIIIPILIFIKTKREILFIDLTMIGAFSYLTLKSLRFSAFLYIVASFIIFKYLKDKIELNKKIPILNELKDILPFVAPRLYITLIASFTIFIGVITTTNSISNPFEKDDISPTIIESIQKENPTQLFNDYNLGGYLIYSDIKPLIDGRADLYSKTLLKDYTSYVSSLDTKLEERYSFDYYLVIKKGLMNNYLKQKDGIELVVEDEDIAFYKNLNFKK